MGTVEPQVATVGTMARHNLRPTDSAVIDALKLNGLDTIYGLPGIPIHRPDAPRAAAGLRVLSFRHEQPAGYAASIRRLPDAEARICLRCRAPGFLNGLNALATPPSTAFPMI